MRNKIFDNLLFTRINLNKISAKKIINKYANSKEKIEFIWLKKSEQDLTEHDEWYYDKNNILNELFSEKIIFISHNNLNKIFNIEFKEDIQYFIVGYYKSVAWIYRYLKNSKVKKIKIVI